MQNITAVETTISLKEILDILNDERVKENKNKLQHSKAMLKVEELSKEPNFWVCIHFGYTPKSLVSNVLSYLRVWVLIWVIRRTLDSVGSERIIRMCY